MRDRDLFQTIGNMSVHGHEKECLTHHGWQK